MTEQEKADERLRNKYKYDTKEMRSIRDSFRSINRHLSAMTFTINAAIVILLGVVFYVKFFLK